MSPIYTYQVHTHIPTFQIPNGNSRIPTSVPHVLFLIFLRVHLPTYIHTCRPRLGDDDPIVTILPPLGAATLTTVPLEEDGRGDIDRLLRFTSAVEENALEVGAKETAATSAASVLHLLDGREEEYLLA